MKTRKHTTSLLSALAISMLCTSLMALVSAHSVYRKYNTDGWSQPIICVLMQGLAHRSSPEEEAGEYTADIRFFSAAPLSAAALDGFSSVQIGTANESGALSGQSDPANQDGSFSGQPDQANQGGSPSGQPSPVNQDGLLSAGQPEDSKTLQAAPEQYTFTDVAPDYFDDALFIGDSRVAGVQLYSGWDNLTYYAEGGMTIYNMFKCQAAKENGRALSVEEALQEYSFGKIYLEIGINEMGTGTVDSFMDAYEKAVARLRELQPDAIIYVCGIMYVKQGKSESDPIFNNPNIQERNTRIAGLADGEHIFYLDINEVVTDETGNLNPKYTWDEVHLLGKYDVLWLEYFSSHGIVKN